MAGLEIIMTWRNTLMTLAIILGSATATPQARAADLQAPAAAVEVVAFWCDAGPERWFAKDASFDAAFRNRFLALHERAARGDLDGWLETPDGAFALVILLDQFPRNAFRGTPRMYATDPQARAAAAIAIEKSFDHAPPLELQKFFYLPFAHAEVLDDQERSVRLCARLGGRDFANAKRHRDIVARFGRFPHRNPILGRAMTPEEQRFLDEGGYAG